MAGGTMNNGMIRFGLTLALFAAPLGACQRAVTEPPLAGATIGGPFSLTDQDGRRVSDTQFAGRYRLIYFGYSFCPDVCPTSLQNLARGLNAFDKASPDRAAKVQPIFITIDPARDTPAVLKPYVAAFHPRLIGLTGSEAEIAKVAKAYAVYYKKQATSGASGYLMDHMSQAMLFGPNGEPIALVPQDEGSAQIAAVLEQWVR
jgi:protein SCO1/2